MAASEDKKELSGLARSISALFGDAPPQPPSPASSPAGGEEMVWEPVEEGPKPGRRAENADRSERRTRGASGPTDRERDVTDREVV